MPSILLSIKPEYVEKILSGEKRYEFRRKLCKDEIDKIYVYPDKRVDIAFKIRDSFTTHD